MKGGERLDIVLYSTGCPQCGVLEGKLQQANIKYSKVEDLDLMISMGLKSIPILEVDGVTMDFMKAIMWVKESGASNGNKH